MSAYILLIFLNKLRNRDKMRSLQSLLFVFMPPKELWEAYSNRTVPPTVRPYVLLRVRCISPIFFEVGIPNLVYGCILG